ncbi:S8 family serine peptidase [Burkholderia sp. AU19243]|uniref:S8 family serine peptidase n=1 Tax=Burkholderia sp. AU19243 TaxID=2824810 RepID=UPI001B9E7F05|nr:S8 family serine peptidase [Burkholderia sp. AU19243]MBR8140854.1 S8 family serine peptidase [Burkholderia vietnamiensis]MBR8361811.1 S8 family serine peptidase [Burkholderia sp. AU19243]
MQFNLSDNTIYLVNRALSDGPGNKNVNFHNAYLAIYRDIKDRADVDPGTINWFSKAGDVNIQLFSPSPAGTWIYNYMFAAAKSQGAELDNRLFQAVSDTIARTVFRQIQGAGGVFDTNQFSPNRIVEIDAGSGLREIQRVYSDKNLNFAIWGGTLFTRNVLKVPTYLSDYGIDVSHPLTRDCQAISAGFVAAAKATAKYLVDNWGMALDLDKRTILACMLEPQPDAPYARPIGGKTPNVDFTPLWSDIFQAAGNLVFHPDDAVALAEDAARLKTRFELPGITGPVRNLINIEINSSPRPQTGSVNQHQASQDVANGFVQNSATSKISFSDGTLNKTDFTSAQMGSLASGGVRPGAFQLDPNAKPGSYLGQFYVDPVSTRKPNAAGLNSAVLNGLSAMTTINTYIDPILLDLTGNGANTTGIEDGVLFDVDHSGMLKRTGWADSATGILVIDDGSGQITNASQMMSEYFGGKAGTNGAPGQTKFKDGFGALEGVDSNRDGVVDCNDAIWSKLRVWVDANHDGKSDRGELKTLDELGITEINVKPISRASGETQNGNEVIGRGTFTINGVIRQLMAVNFLADPVGSMFAPVDGGTRVTSTTGSVTRTAFTSASVASETLDAAKLGVDNVYAGKGDTTLIAAPSGSWLVGGGGSNTYRGGAGDDVFVISARDNPDHIRGNGGRDIAIIVGDQGVTLNLAKAGLTIAEGGRGDDVLISGGNSSAFIKGGQGNTTIIGGGGNDVLVGGSGHNTIIGGTGKAVIYAGPNGDTIYASAAGSIIHAGGSADRIFGGAGDDVIEAGHGDAIIDGGGGTNVVTLHGNHGDYAITRTETGYTIVDRHARRDGSLTLKNVQKLNFSNISAVDLTLPNPMPVSDSLRVDQAGQAFDHTRPHLIAAAQLLSNDQRLNSQGPLKIASVGDAVGGTASLTQSGDVLFTPDRAFNGVMSFKYGIVDAAGNPAATVVDLNSGATAPMRATVTLSPPEVPDDPLTSQEWYLSDVNIIPVWQDYTGKGVRIGQFEPGGQFATTPEILDIRHPDLAPNIDRAWLATQTSNGTLPQAVSNHATMVAGVMVAARNGQGGVGVAYDATIGGHYLANSGADLTGLGNMVNYDVANNSWGFVNDFVWSNLQAGKINTESALLANAQYAAGNGRGGLGTVIVAAGGNAREKGGSAQGSLTNNNRFTIEVGAINAQSDLSTLQPGSSPFSSPGASLLVSAPGSNVVSTSHILETDRGSTFGSQYSDMQGTSFAAPIVSGVVALMLQANPNLGYRDVQEILALSAKRVRDTATKWSENGARNWNGGGMHASHDYGFGKVDARAAVRLAESWARRSTAANERVYAATSGTLARVISAGSTFSSMLTMQSGLTVQHAEIDFDAHVGQLGDLVVKLISPDGTESILLDRAGKAPGTGNADVGNPRSGAFKYTFVSTHDWGERSGGTWTLEVTDSATGLPVTLNQWSLRLYGNRSASDDTYFYTDEYRSLSEGSAARAVLDDGVNGTRGGRNTINAAAVSGDTSIDLTTGAASIGGAALTIRNPGAIQNIVTGDGDDRLVAGDGDALLDGGRGTNTLTGGKGKDFFVVHRRANGLDTIENFEAARGEKIDLVGFAGRRFSDLVLSQQRSDVRIDVGNGQQIVVKNLQVATLTADHFLFQDSFIAPANYVDCAVRDERLPDAGGTVVLNGGAKGVSYTTDAQGRLIASLAGVVYSHDAAKSDTFVIAKQDGVSNYRNALRGFKHGIDKIDLSQTGITSFSDLVIAQQNRATINGLSQIHGVSLASKSLGTNGTPLELIYLDAIDTAQLDEADFIFATQVPGFAGIVTAPPSDTQPPEDQAVTPTITPAPGGGVSIPLIKVDPVKPVVPIKIDPVKIEPIRPIVPIKLDAVKIEPIRPIVPIKLDAVKIEPIRPIAPIKLDAIKIEPIKPIAPIKLDVVKIEPIRAVAPVFQLDPLKPVVSPFPGAGTPKLSGRSMSVRMLDSAKPWTSEDLSTLFAVPQGEAVTYTATLADGRPLPDWLKFDTIQNRLSVVAGTGPNGKVDVKVHATTRFGESAVSTLQLLVKPNMIDVASFKTLDITDSQAAVNMSNAFSKVSATSGRHVLLQSGAFTSATLAGNDSNEVVITGTSAKLATGNGDNKIELFGSGATVNAGDGNNAVTTSDSSASISVGNGNNAISGQFRSLSVGSGKNIIYSAGAAAIIDLGDGHNAATIAGSLSTVHVKRGTYELDYVGPLGKLVFGTDVSSERLWFRSAGQDLKISVVGGAGDVTLKNWYAKSPDRPSNIVAGDGKNLSSYSVENLVQAMAAFAPPSAGIMAPTPDTQKSLQPTLAANWY